MRHYARYSIALLLMLLLPMATFAGGQEEAVDEPDELPQINAQIAHSPNPGGTAGAEAFADYVTSESDGMFTVEPISYQALGSVREVTDQVRLGEMEFHAPGTVGLVGVWPDLQMVNLPFLFTNRDAFWEVMQEEDYIEYIRENILAASRGGIRYLGAAENSVRNLYTNREVRVPEDLQGIQIRVQ